MGSRACYTNYGILDQFPVQIRKSRSEMSVSTLFLHYLEAFCASIDHFKVIWNPNTRVRVDFLMPSVVVVGFGWKPTDHS